jgi:DNA-binding NarL/FixJ family response regulator
MMDPTHNPQPDVEVQGGHLKPTGVDPDESGVIRILIVGESDVVSQSLATSLVTLGFDAATSSDWGSDDMTTAIGDLQPTVVILRATPSTALDRLRLVSCLGNAGAAVLLLSEPLDVATSDAAAEAGVAGVLATSDPIDRVLDAIQFANTLGRTETPGVQRVSALPGHWSRASSRFNQLSRVEAAVLQRLAEGLSPAQIAAERYVAVSTVRSQLKAIYRKLGVRSQVAAVALARERAARSTA